MRSRPSQLRHHRPGPPLIASSTRRALVALLTVFALFALSVAPAALASPAAPGAPVPPGAPVALGATGGTPVRGTPVRPASVAAELLRATGHSAGQLTTRAACGAASGPMIRCFARVLTERSTGQAVPPLHAPRPARPDLQPAAGATGSEPAAYTAAFLQSAYDSTWLAAHRGSDDTVAIVDAYGDSTAYSDMETFRAANGLPSLPACSASLTTSCFALLNQDGQSAPLPGSHKDTTGGWNVEESLDIDAVSSICPLCRILVVEANSDDSTGASDLEAGVLTAAAQGADQISLSWGSESLPDAAGNAWPYASIGSAAVLAAAGDGAYSGPAVSYPAALPNVTAVGGTSLTASPSAPRGYAESAWSVGTCAHGSTCGTESGCDLSQTAPAYQSDITTDCSGRAYNDISADADPSTGLAIYDSQPGSEGCGTANNWCIVGGTSLATPLTAALDGLAGISASTPAWTYRDAGVLNDITSGSDGSCPSGELLICNAGIGWDGPTGNGSISGAVVAGGPGIGGSAATGVNGTDATLTAGLYPNGEPTSFAFHYWPSDQPASSTLTTAASSAAGGALQSVAVSLCASLTPNTTYDYLLQAINSSGSASGWAGSFTTAATETAPTSSSAPAISGALVSGQTLTGADALWQDAACVTSPGHAWQESTTDSGPWQTVATGLSYTLTAADAGDYLRFTSSATNAAGTTTVVSPVVGPVPAPESTAPPPTASDSGAGTGASPASGTSAGPGAGSGPGAPTTPLGPGSAVSPTEASSPAAPAAGSGARSAVTRRVRFYRCALRCVLLDTHGAQTYTPRPADYGQYIKVVTVTARAGAGRPQRQSTRWVGPVTAAGAGDIAVAPGAVSVSTLTIRGSTRRALAAVRVLRRMGTRLTMVIRPEARTAPTHVWAYLTAGGAVLRATPIHLLDQILTLNLSVRPGQTVRLVAVRT